MSVLDKSYEVQLVTSINADGEIYWTAVYPELRNCVGGGSTAEEALREAAENLKIYLEYLEIIFFSKNKT